MAHAFICNRRSDIPPGVLQVLDLRPNESQRNLIYEPPGQTKYLNRPQNDLIQTQGTGPITTTLEFKGLAAYLIDHIEAGGVGGGGGNPALTWQEANVIALDLQQRMDAGLPLTLADVNASLSATVPGTELTGAGGSFSTGNLGELLAIMAGGEYVLPAGTEVETAGNIFNTTISGVFSGEKYRDTYTGVFLDISSFEGMLSKLRSSDFVYAGVAGAAVVVYNEDGSVLS